MYNKSQFFLIVILSLFVVSCGSKKGVITKKKDSIPKTVENDVNTNPEPTSTDHYISLYKDIAKEEMVKYKIPASITLAQGILESASGRGRLAVKANNHFGIKCHDWEGAKIYHDDDAAQECFRKYDDPRSSYEDHSIFLSTRKRYSKLFDYNPSNYRAWARGLRSAGYATDRRYPEKLISLIERYNLYKYDQEVLGQAYTKSEIIEKINSHVVVKGDTLYSLSKKYNTTVEHIMTLNRLNSTDLKIGQVLILNSN